MPAAHTLELFRFGAQIFGILTGRKPAFQAENTNLACSFHLNRHALAFHDIMIGLPHQLIVPAFYPVLDTALLARKVPLADAAEAIVQGGARILQLRHKGHWSRTMFADAQAILQLCRTAGALFFVNDRPDVAALLETGLHLGQDDLPPAAARKLLAPTQPLGFSTHNEAQLRAALDEPVDYIALGPIFATSSKENPDPVVGLEELRRLGRIADRPLVAIGGITRERAVAVLDAGADSVAVIGDLLPEQCTKRTLRARTEEWVQLLNRKRSQAL